jgi:hypothetical protein
LVLSISCPANSTDFALFAAAGDPDVRLVNELPWLDTLKVSGTSGGVCEGFERRVGAIPYAHSRSNYPQLAIAHRGNTATSVAGECTPMRTLEKENDLGPKNHHEEASG